MSAADGVPDVVELRQDEQRAMLDLLHRIRHAIGTVHLNLAGGFIYRKLVVPEVEFAISQREALNHAQLRRLFEVEVAGIVPAAHVHPRDVIAAFVFPVGRCRLVPAVELLPDHWRHAAIIEVRSAMPQAVAFANGNVIHLRSNVMVQAVLPNVGVSVVRDRKGRGASVCVLDDIKAGVLHRSEVKFGIDVAQPRCGRRDRALEHLLVRSVFHQARHSGRLWGVVLRIEFEHRDF